MFIFFIPILLSKDILSPLESNQYQIITSCVKNQNILNISILYAYFYLLPLICFCHKEQRVDFLIYSNVQNILWSNQVMILC